MWIVKMENMTQLSNYQNSGQTIHNWLYKAKPIDHLRQKVPRHDDWIHKTQSIFYYVYITFFKRI